MSTLKVNAVQTTGSKPILNSSGSVLQVVQGTDSTQRSTTSGTFADTNLSVTITPTSTSSKVLVTWSHQVGSQSNNSIRGAIRLLRDSTVIASWNPVTFVNTGQPNGDSSCSSATYLDSPGTTSAVTYKTQFSKYGGGSYGETFYINQLQDSIQSVGIIIAQEIT